jgi:hypothetical protein
MAEDREIAGQVRTELADGGLVLSCAKAVEDGARAALLVAPGLFRLDVSPIEDTLSIGIRNLSPGACAWSSAESEPQLHNDATVEVLERLRPAAHAYRIEVAGRRVDVLISTAQALDEGRVQFVAQARVDP